MLALFECTRHIPPYTFLYRHMTVYASICRDIRVSGFQMFKFCTQRGPPVPSGVRVRDSESVRVTVGPGHSDWQSCRADTDKAQKPARAHWQSRQHCRRWGWQWRGPPLQLCRVQAFLQVGGGGFLWLLPRPRRLLLSWRRRRRLSWRRRRLSWHQESSPNPLWRPRQCRPPRWRRLATIWMDIKTFLCGLALFRKFWERYLVMISLHVDIW